MLKWNRTFANVSSKLSPSQKWRWTRLKKALIHDTGQPPDVNIIPDKGKINAADDNLPSSHSGMQLNSTSDFNTGQSESDKTKFVIDRMVSSESEDCVSGESSHDRYAKECDQKGNKNSAHGVNQKLGDDIKGSFAKFEALNMLPSSSKSDGTNDSIAEGSDNEEVDYEGDVDKYNILEMDRKCSVSSSLKLKFKTVDGATTVSNMNKGRESVRADSDSSTGGMTEKGDLSVDRSGEFAKLLEQSLVDSSSDSESDSNGCKKENVGEECVWKNETVGDESRDDMKTTVETDNANSETLEGSREPTEEKLCLSYIPARSAAVKAMSKMKPVLEIDGDADERREHAKSYSGAKRNVVVKSTDVHSKSYTASMPSKNAIYACHYCSDIGASSLRMVKSHLANQHSGEQPMVVNLKFKQHKKKSSFYVCPFSTCNKLFVTYHDVALHRSSHPSGSLQSEMKSPQSFTSITPLLSPDPLVPWEAGTIPDCRVLLKPLTESELMEALGNDNTSRAGPSTNDGEKRYGCLYCTEHFSCSTLSRMKHHYAAEHPGQLLVFRDIEAKREKLASRIYVCEESDCDFTAFSRTELDAHAKCHKSNCTFVYECAACGWYSSSFWTAKDHLLNEHSIQDNGYLIHMQLSVDENGHTSKKVLRSV